MKQTEENKQISYKDLTPLLKLAILGGWLTMVSFTIGFIMGFIGL